MATPTSRVRAAAGALLVLAVAFYAPLSFTYFWNGHSGPNLQDDVFKLLISPTFAFGHGSGHDVRPDTHEAHFATFASTYVAPVVAGCVLPYVVHTAWLARMARQAQQRGNGSAAAAWRTYLAGALVAPTTGALAYGFGVLVHGMNTQEAWYMVGYLWGGTLVLAYVAHATVTTRWARRAAPTPATAGGELQPA